MISTALNPERKDDQMAYDAPIPSDAPSPSTWAAFQKIMAFDGIPEPPDDLILLKRARNRVAYAWCQRNAYDPHTDGVCFLAALLCAVQDLHHPRPHTGIDEAHLERLVRHLGAPFHNIGDVISFNDYPGRKKEEILAILDAAIIRLEWMKPNKSKPISIPTNYYAGIPGEGAAAWPGASYEKMKAMLTAFESKAKVPALTDF